MYIQLSDKRRTLNGTLAYETGKFRVQTSKKDLKWDPDDVLTKNV